jgi:hypothetical protein
MATKGSNWRVWTILMFGFLLLLDTALYGFAAGRALRDPNWKIWGDDFSPVLRLLIFLLGAGLAWGVGRMTVAPWIRGVVTVADAVPAAWCFVFLVAVFFTAVAFAGVLHWAFLLLLLVIAVFVSAPAFWKLLGGTTTGLALFLALVAGFAAFYFGGIE